MGISMADIREMPWGRLVLMLQAKAQAYSKEEEVREATPAQVAAFFGR